MVSSKSFHIVTNLNFLPHSNIRHHTVTTVGTQNVDPQAPKFFLGPALDVTAFDIKDVLRLDVGIIAAEDGPVARFAANVVVRPDKFPSRRPMVAA